MMVCIQPKEMNKLANIWEFHRTYCAHKGGVLIELPPISSRNQSSGDLWMWQNDGRNRLP